VKHFLTCSLAISQKKVDTFTPNSALSHCCGQSMTDPEHLPTFIFKQVRQVRCVSIRYDKHVTRCDGLNIHYGSTEIIAVNHGNLKFTC
jgi:hypothetical protein